MFWLLLGSLITGAASLEAAVVEKVSRKQNRVLLRLDAEEVGLFRSGDSVSIKVGSNAEVIDGKVIKLRSKDHMILELDPLAKLPIRGMEVLLTPTYETGWRDGGSHYRDESGDNQYGENRFFLLEGGDGFHATALLSAGIRLGFYQNSQTTVSLGLSRGQFLGKDVTVTQATYVLRASYVFLRKFLGGYPKSYLGFGYKRTDLTPLVDETVREDINQNPAGRPSVAELEAMEAFSTDYFLDLGCGLEYSFETTSLGNIVIAGMDLFSWQQTLFYGKRDRDDPFLNGLYSLDQKGIFYQRLYIGFSF